MWLVHLPGVYRPQCDTRLLAQALGSAAIPPGAEVLDIGTGSGALAVAAVEAGAGHVTAVDISALAAFSTWVNVRLRGLPITVRRGDGYGVGTGRRFDVVLANPPYVPSRKPKVRERGRSRAWNAGADGRDYLNPLCARIPELLQPGGMVLLVQSAICGVEATLQQLRVAGLKSTVVAREVQPFGPIMSERAGFFESAGLIEPGQRHEELVVIRGDRPNQATRQAAATRAHDPEWTDPDGWPGGVEVGRR